MSENLAALLAEVEERVDEQTLVLALGATPDELELIRVGRIPEDGTAQRLRMLHEMVEQRGADLAMPQAALRLTWMPHVRRWVVAFVILDVLFVAGAALVFVLLR